MGSNEHEKMIQSNEHVFSGASLRGLRFVVGRFSYFSSLEGTPSIEIERNLIPKMIVIRCNQWGVVPLL